jgi:8-oxo-dGTP diphosphatase
VQPREGAAAVILASGRILLVKENYGKRRYALPGGAVDAGETHHAAAVRELLEETGVEGAVDCLLGTYRLDDGFTCSVFRCTIVAGTPARPDTGEIAEVGWFPLDAIPSPVTNVLHHALPDIRAGRRGVVRERLPRIS